MRYGASRDNESERTRPISGKFFDQLSGIRILPS
jgi:hypothetical protein